MSRQFRDMIFQLRIVGVRSATPKEFRSGTPNSIRSKKRKRPNLFLIRPPSALFLSSRTPI